MASMKTAFLRYLLIFGLLTVMTEGSEASGEDTPEPISTSCALPHPTGNYSWKYPNATVALTGERMSTQQAIFICDYGYKPEIPDDNSLYVECTVPGGRAKVAYNQRTCERMQMNWDSYHRYETIVSFMDSLDELPENTMCSTFTIGESYEGRIMKGVKCGQGSHEVWISGGPQGRAWIAPASVTYVINKFARHPEDHAKILETFTLYMLPVANPDGYEFSHTDDRLWRKSRSINDGSSCVGTDLNRNYDYHWNEEGSSPDPCAELYAGPEAFSEPESRAIRDFLMEHKDNLLFVITFDGWGQQIYFPYAYDKSTETNNSYQQRQVAWYGRQWLIDAATKYDSSLNDSASFYQNNDASYYHVASGTLLDWAKDIVGVRYSYSVLLRDDGTYGFELPEYFIEISGVETLGMLRGMLTSIIDIPMFAKDPYWWD